MCYVMQPEQKHKQSPTPPFVSKGAGACAWLAKPHLQVFYALRSKAVISMTQSKLAVLITAKAPELAVEGRHKGVRVAACDIPDGLAGKTCNGLWYEHILCIAMP